MGIFQNLGDIDDERYAPATPLKYFNAPIQSASFRPSIGYLQDFQIFKLSHQTPPLSALRHSKPLIPVLSRDEIYRPT